MKKSKTLYLSRLPVLTLAIMGGIIATAPLMAASYEWRFDAANLNAAVGNGTMSYADGETASLSSFGNTGSGVPNIGGQVASFLHVPSFANLGNGYHLTFADTVPNGGGSYVNQYTFIIDFLSPGVPNWTALFNTNPNNPSGNDADFYIAPDRSVGIGSTYSSTGLIASDTWYRLAFVADLSANTLTYYLNGSQIATGGGGGLDGRFALNSNADAGPDLLLFNEGDTSGNYTHELYLNGVAFVDRAMGANELLALGGPNAEGILVPEPGTVGLACLGLISAALLRQRARRTAP